jgi:O-succinylbenzoic acid--CoA ligase
VSKTVNWVRPAVWDGTAASLAEHVEAIGAMTAGDTRLWLGPFDPPATLPAGYEDTALVVPTSGSTGRAKAVAHGLDSLLASDDATAALFASDGTAAATAGHGFWLPLLPPTHIAGIQVIARAHRAAQVLGLDRVPLPQQMPDLSAHFDAASFAQVAARALSEADDAGLPAFTSLVPTQLTRILADPSADGVRARGLLARFVAVLVGGAATPPDLLARTRAARIAARTTYGSSETAGGCVYDGLPLPGVRLSVDGPDDDEGRLRIVSPTLAHGYLLPDGAADQDAFTDAGTRTFTTSDLAHLDPDGHLRVIGRADDVIVTGGLKVVPQDVERAIDRSLMLRDVVADAVVVGVPDAEWGSRVEALVVPRPGADPHELPALVRAALRTTGVSAHRIPRHVHVVDELPTLGIGKVDRTTARRIAQDRCR